MTVATTDGFGPGRIELDYPMRGAAFATAERPNYAGDSGMVPPLFSSFLSSTVEYPPMRFSPTILLFAIAIFSANVSTARAQDSPDYAARMSARRDLELAKMELRHYWQVEYPRQQRHLNAVIELTQAEIRDYRERLRAYRPFDRFSIGQPFLVTLQELRMCLRDAELRLRDLWAERNALVRFHSDEWRYLEMNVHSARLRVAELEADLPQNDEQLTDNQPRVAAVRKAARQAEDGDSLPK